MKIILDSSMQTISFLGSIWVYTMFTILFFLYSTSWLFLLILLVLFFTTSIVYFIKWFFPTKRPDHGRKKGKYFWLKVNESSFPSAHASRAAGLVVISFFMKILWFEIFSILFLLVISYSRIYLKRHYWKDIAAGIIIGLICGWISILVARPVSEWVLYFL